MDGPWRRLSLSTCALTRSKLEDSVVSQRIQVGGKLPVAICAAFVDCNPRTAFCCTA